MKPEMLKRYLILLAALVVCAGVVWYFTNASAKPAEDAVLAYWNGCEEGAAVQDAEMHREVARKISETDAGEGEDICQVKFSI